VCGGEREREKGGMRKRRIFLRESERKTTRAVMDGEMAGVRGLAGKRQEKKKKGKAGLSNERVRGSLKTGPGGR